MLLILAISLNVTLAMGQSNKEELDNFLRSNKEVPKILLVGTYHFGYPGLDTHKTNDANKVDINSPQRQKEVEDLVEYIARYKPTKILVETGPNTGFLVERYNEWKKNKGTLKKREIDQIGFRLMDQFDIDTLYGIDAYSLSRELIQSKDSIYAKPIFERIYRTQPDSLTESDFEKKYWEWYDLQDKRCVDMKLLDYFLEMNSDYHINRMHGHYILSDKTDSYSGIDGMMLNWYSRNLRILKNVQKISTNPEDKLMILIGSGHVPILKHLFESSPEYELVKFGEL